MVGFTNTVKLRIVTVKQFIYLVSVVGSCQSWRLSFVISFITHTELMAVSFDFGYF
jgi:hypothetical protein